MLCRCGNVASILALDDKLNRDFKLFHDVPDPENSAEVQKRSLVPYFM
jgi:serine/threonine-protein phosphatase 6 catalytic subunit